MRVNKFLAIFIAFLLVGWGGCSSGSQDEVRSVPKEASVIYELNLRQFSKEGTIAAAKSHLSRLKELGVNIIWFMPIQPISREKRKGELGSYYAISDYKKINPEYGKMQEFKDLVKEMHRMGFKVILDWVANHTGWDNPWIKEHPEYYTQDSNGNIIDPIDPSTGKSWDWTDVADLNYDNQEMCDEMIKLMSFWVEEVDIDGFRCDVAHNVPIDFWEKARQEIDKIKSCFWLAEAEKPELMKKAFDASYAWELLHITNSIAKGEKKATVLNEYFSSLEKKNQPDDIMMNFITNHDENSWAGTVFERYGEGHKTFAVLMFTIPGMPLIHNGQEVGLNKRLKFFEKDEIFWNQNSSLTSFYKRLTKLKGSSQALLAGEQAGNMSIVNQANENVFTFFRQKENQKIFVVLNFSNAPQKLEASSEKLNGKFKEYFTGKEMSFDGSLSKELNPWEFNVFISL